MWEYFTQMLGNWRISLSTRRRLTLSLLWKPFFDEKVPCNYARIPGYSNRIRKDRNTQGRRIGLCHKVDLQLQITEFPLPDGIKLLFFKLVVNRERGILFCGLQATISFIGFPNAKIRPPNGNLQLPSLYYLAILTNIGFKLPSTNSWQSTIWTLKTFHRFGSSLDPVVTDFLPIQLSAPLSATLEPQNMRMFLQR